jgi:glycosyltransferase involved in cell wall biosynthesis
MFGNPLISIILLCYNHENFVEEAIEGVFLQTYSPLEIVIVDDCSTDNTADIIEARTAGQRCGQAIRFVRNTKNIGGWASAKLGLDMTQGRFIIIASGDDIMLPELVAEIARVWMTDNVSLVTANASYIDERSNSLNRTFRDPNIPADDTFETLARDGSNACCFGPAIGFERAIYTTFGWPPAYLNAYDIMLPFYAYLLKGARFISKPLLKYRVHGQNSSSSLRAEKANALERVLIEERMYLDHLAHGTLMEEVLVRLCDEAPQQYSAIAGRILPLLTIQLSEMAKKLVRVSRQSGTLAQSTMNVPISGEQASIYHDGQQCGSRQQNDPTGS